MARCEIPACANQPERWLAGWDGNKPIYRLRCVGHGPAIASGYADGYKDGHAAGFAAGYAAAHAYLVANPHLHPLNGGQVL